MKRTLSAVVAAVFLILVAVAVLFLIPRMFLASDTFRSVVIQETRNSTGFRGEWMPFRLEGWTLTSAGFEGTRMFEGSRFQLRVDEVRIALNWRGLLTRQWEIEEIQIQELDLKVDTRTGATEPDPAPGISDSASVKSPSPLAFLVPRRVEAAQVNVLKANVHIHMAESETISLTDLKVKARPDSGLQRDSWSMALSEGLLQLPERPHWSLNSARLEWSPDALTVLESEWFGAEAGILRISGPLMAESRFQADLKLKGTGIPLKSIVPERWRSFFRGNLSGEADLLASSERLHLRGETTGSGVTLVGVPALLAMQHATGIAKWTELPLDTAYTEFDYQNEVLILSTAILESENLVRTEGHLKVGPDKKLEGLFQIGLAPNVTSKLPGADTAVFILEENGYRWATPPMQVSGTMDSPREDLSPRLKGAIFEAVEETVREKVDRGMNLLDALLRQVQ